MEYKYIRLRTDSKNVVTVVLKNPTSNSWTIELSEELLKLLNDLKSRSIRGMIITSYSNKIFSSGINLNEVHKPSRIRIRRLVENTQKIYNLLSTTSFPTAALINGHAVGVGAFLATCCEYRVMLKNFGIGFIEPAMGVPTPVWTYRHLKHIVGGRNAEFVVTSGKIFDTEEALKIGLIDEVALDKSEAFMKIETYFKRFDNLSLKARTFTKRALREDDLQMMEKSKDNELDSLVNFIMEPDFQEHLNEYMAKRKITPSKL